MREGKSRKARWILWPSLLGAMVVLGVLGYRLAMEEWWIRQLASPNAKVRAHAAEALADMDSGRAIGPMLRAVAVLQKDKALRSGSGVFSIREALMRTVGPEDRGTLHGLLQDPDAAVREMSASLLGLLPRDRETFDRLVAVLDRPRPPPTGNSTPNDERPFAINSLEIYGRLAIPVLRRQLKGSNASTDEDWLGSVAASTLTTMGPNAKEAFSELLEKARRSQIPTFVILAFDNPRSLDSETLRDVIPDLKSNDAEVRLRAIQLLADSTVDDSDIVDLLIAALEDPSKAIQGHAIHVLASVAPRFADRVRFALERALSSQEPKIAVWAALGLHAIRPEDPSAAKVLVEYRNESIQPASRYRAYAEDPIPDPWGALDEALATLANEHRPLLETSLRSPDDYLAVRAAHALLRSDPTHAAAQETLIARRGSTDPLAIGETLRALTCIEPAAGWAREKFENYLENHEQADQGLKPLAWLARANAVRGSLVGLEERWAEEEKLDYQFFPLLTCVSFRPSYLPEFERLLGSRAGFRVQLWAMEVLSRMTGSAHSAARALLGALKARQTYLHRFALKGLARLRPRGLGVAEALLPVIERRQDAIHAFRVLETLGDEAVPHLVKLFAHADPEIRTLAAWTLGQIGPDARSSVLALAKALADDSDLVTRISAAEALGRIGPAALTAIPGLESAARAGEPLLSRYARGALRRLAQ